MQPAPTLNKTKVPLIEDDLHEFLMDIFSGEKYTYCQDVDRYFFLPDIDKFVLFEFLKCEEAQIVSPWESHPSRFWDKPGVAKKFWIQYELARRSESHFIIVNWAKMGTKNWDRVRWMQVDKIDENGITLKKDEKLNYRQFKLRMIELNRRAYASGR